ncbi:MAG: hypothetical protein VYC34_12445 [Planctomycetota bacterium]|nr:hypothetical protein [Planctomycetota bacterium]
MTASEPPTRPPKVRRPPGTFVARIGLLMLVGTIFVAAFVYDHIIWFYIFIAAVASLFIITGLFMNYRHWEAQEEMRRQREAEDKAAGR